MTSPYFSDREKSPPPRTNLAINSAAWGGLVALIDSYVANGGFGADFPELCPDGRGPTGTDDATLGRALRGEIPDIEWPLQAGNVPATPAVLDLLEFCHRHIAEPIQRSYHSFFGHYHLDFDRDHGRQQFRERASRILARQRTAYDLSESGIIVRLAAPILDEALSTQVFATGDSKLDELLEGARRKFLDPDSHVRREALEKLWDAWERVKTIEPGKDKKASTEAILAKTAEEPTFRRLLEDEARSLTTVGNTFHIRHSETSQVELGTEDHVDYLFHRLFALIWLLLRAR
jgi:hypothetical protein